MASLGWTLGLNGLHSVAPPTQATAGTGAFTRMCVHWMAKHVSDVFTVYPQLSRGSGETAGSHRVVTPAQGMATCLLGPILHSCFNTWAPRTKLLDTNANLTARPRSLCLKSFSGDSTVEPGTENQVQTSRSLKLCEKSTPSLATFQVSNTHL